MNNTKANHEKEQAALSSVTAAVVLTGFKIIVGITTGSLGILAEAAHSALDLVAALVTLFAVKVSGKPADSIHNYGHGKVENLSALFETLLLLLTCGWIIYEAVQRLFFKTVEIEVNVWAFIVMMVSIVIDYSRSRVLYRAARKYNSQALEADALHFRTDIWSSSVVILGLIGVKASEYIPALGWMHQADAVAAMLVAGIVIFISVELGSRTIRALMDSAPEGLHEKIQQVVCSFPDVGDCHQIRIRSAGASTFIDIHITVDPEQHLVEVHKLSDKIELAIQELVPGADITVHPEPAGL